MHRGVRRLAAGAIDRAAWDAAVLADPLAKPYGLSWWLDAATADRWEGLVLDDYRVVLPLPRLRRYRVMPVHIRPPFTQQLGPFGNLQSGDLKRLLEALPRKFQTALPLAPSIPLDEVPTGFRVRRRVNYVLDLARPFAEVKKDFQKRMRQYLNRTGELAVHPVSGTAVIGLCRDHLGDRGGIRDFHWKRLAAIIDAAEVRDRGFCRGISGNGELLCVGFYPHLNGRAYNLAAASTPAGFEQRGMIHLLATVMEDLSDRPGAAFDFEGSELPGVREFFSRFGGQDEGYHLVERKWYGLA